MGNYPGDPNLDISDITASKSVIRFSVLTTIFVDTKASLFPSREQLCKGILLIQDLFAKLGMEIHIGTKKLNKDTQEIEWKASKTECVFSPPPASSIPGPTKKKREKKM